MRQSGVYPQSQVMARNLIISYDLYNPGQDYSKVIEAIKGLGSWAKIQKSVWYVKSELSAAQAVNVIWPKMDKNDSLFVADCKNNEAAWQNLSKEVSDYLIANWQR